MTTGGAMMTVDAIRQETVIDDDEARLKTTTRIAHRVQTRVLRHH
jgi:hypothetical protein